MKKVLLLAAAALLGVCANQASAATYYRVAGESVSSTDGITPGKYFLHARLNAAGFADKGRAAEGFVYGDNEGVQPCVHYGGSADIKTIPAIGIVNANYVWEIEGTAEGFSLKNLGGNYYVSTGGGNNADPRGNWKSAENDSQKALLKLVNIPADAPYNVSTEANPRFWLQITNKEFNNGTSHGYPCVNSNGPDSGHENVAYWLYGEAGYANFVQFEIIPVETVDVVTQAVTLHMPAINGVAVPDKTVTVSLGDEITPYIAEAANEMGGMKNIAATSVGANASDLIVSAENHEFNVTGNWNRELIENYVYRLCLNPNHNPAALRYMLASEVIQTQVDGAVSLSRLIPERLWYFKKGAEEGTYTMHTLYDTTRGVYFPEIADNAHATLGAEPTVFVLNAKNNGDFSLRVQGTTQTYINDFAGVGYFSLWNHENAAGGNGSNFRVYPLTDDDYSILGLESDTEPTVDNVLQPVLDFNAVNLPAALRRIGYLGGEPVIGTNPGQYNNADNTLLENIHYAQEINAKTDATDEEIARATAGIDIATISFNDMIPGHYYRFKNKASGLYISSISTTSIKQKPGNEEIMRDYMDITDDATRSNTVFYLHEANGKYTLVSLDEGLVLPKFDRYSANWVPVVSTDAEAASDVEFSYQEEGGFIIHVDTESDGTHRHLYGAAKTQNNSKIVDCGDGTDDTYQWLVERVHELPVTLYHVDVNDNKGWASVHSPVELSVPADAGVIVNSAKFTGSQVEKTKLGAGNVIPANTTVLLDYQGEGAADPSTFEGREHISYIYLPVNYKAATSTEETYFDNDAQTSGRDLDGGIFAIAKEEGKKYFTLHASTSNNFREFNEHQRGYIPGFKAHIAIDANDPAADSEYFEITDPEFTAISQVASPAAAAEVYDLQGRRLAAPVKGLNIINGRKVIK